MLSAGTVIHWNDYLPKGGKFIFIIGTGASGLILGFTISSQEHWWTNPLHRPAMVEIPQGAAVFLPRRSFIQCFFELERISKTEYEQALIESEVRCVGRLRHDFIRKVRDAVVENIHLSRVDIEESLALLNDLPKANLRPAAV
jgi:hypothetical protein